VARPRGGRRARDRVDTQAEKPKIVAVRGAHAHGGPQCAAIENARQSRVVIVNRRGEFSRTKTGNLNQLRQAIDSGALKCQYNAEPVRIEAGHTLCYHGLGSSRAVMPLEGV